MKYNLLLFPSKNKHYLRITAVAYLWLFLYFCLVYQKPNHMKTRCHYLLLLATLLFVSQEAFSQTQNGYVKTRGRLQKDGSILPGERIPDAIVAFQDRNAVKTRRDGSFQVRVPEGVFSISEVSKSGYVLSDPDVLARQYTVSGTPLALVMETPDMHADDRLEAERRIRKTLQKKLDEKTLELDQLKEQSRITAEEYRRRIQSLFNEQADNDRLVREMAERYSRIDYDQLDDFNRQVCALILDGKLAQADSLIKAKGNIEDRFSVIRLQQNANAREEAELKRRSHQLEKSKALVAHSVEDLARDCYSKYEIHKLQHQNDSARYYIELRASLDTTNVDWQVQAGNFINEYISDFDASLNYYRRCIEVSSSKAGDGPELPILYNKMANMYYSLEDFENAAAYYELSLKTFRERGLESTHQMASVLLELQRLYLARGDFKHAEECILQAKEIESHLEKLDSMDLVGVYNAAAVYLRKKGEISQARDTLIRAYGIVERHAGKRDVTRGVIPHNIGALSTALSDYDTSLKYLESALAFFRSIYDEVHPRISASHNEIGGLYYRLGKIDLAISHMKESVAIEEKVYGTHHTSTAVSYNNLASMYNKIRHFDLALEYQEKAADIFLTVLGEDSDKYATILSQIGVTYFGMKEYEKAFECFQHSLEIKERILDADHPDLATTYNNFSVLLQMLGKDEESLPYKFKSLDINMKRYGPKSWQVASDYSNIASSYIDLDRYDEAIRYLNDALDIRQSIWGEKHQDVALVYDGLGSAYGSKGDYQESLRYFFKAAETYSDVEGKENSDTALILRKIAHVYERIGDRDNAKKYYREAYEMAKATLGENHRTTKSILAGLEEVSKES